MKKTVPKDTIKLFTRHHANNKYRGPRISANDLRNKKYDEKKILKDLVSSLVNEGFPEQ